MGNKRSGFASMDKKKLKQITSKGGSSGKGLKGWAYMKANDPERFKKLQAKGANHAKKITN